MNRLILFVAVCGCRNCFLPNVVPDFAQKGPFLPKKPPFRDVLANILHFFQKKLQKVLEVKKKAIPLHPLSETNSTTTQSNA